MKMSFERLVESAGGENRILFWGRIKFVHMICSSLIHPNNTSSNPHIYPPPFPFSSPLNKQKTYSQLEKRRSIQYLMDGRRRSTIDCNRRSTIDSSVTNPYLQAQAAAREHRKSIRRSSSFDNGDNEGDGEGGEGGELESAEQLRESLRGSIGNSMTSSFRGSMDNMTDGRNSFSRMSYEDDDNEDNDNPLDVSMIDADAPASAAVAAWRAYHGENNNNKKSDEEGEEQQHHIHVPNHTPMAAAAIAHASAQTTSEMYAAKHPYNATTTAVPAVAAQDPYYNQKRMSSNNKERNNRRASIEICRRAIETAPPCTHYERNCHIVSPCCGATFGCRICHDDCPVLPPKFDDMMMMRMNGGGGDSAAAAAGGGSGSGGRKYQRVLRTSSMPSSFEANIGPPEHHNVDRFAIKEIICRECFTKQSSKT